ncbi:sulfite exporter TauE/SafE family protein [Vreelandella populi]|uniref:Probable membrane transporter protein n=1 Tax=Vreelandella populi TaxID=2498858 RepID=A0A3S0X0G6_9GAMM|nr:sulfite exporter TauE/SafE family protein [Halomonas populi]RUR36502.1 sulfite exporter TauE/SafE family protein [Halomonas populi]RUR44963.1 sulfite exporter TauE/SafE family protein [Halomonas populi]RUR51297.1 sulfite exporter TauE/SafE family protein [Halomonas populi]
MHDSMVYLLFLVGTFLVAGVVKGVTGMGLPTVAMGLLGMAMPPASAAALLVLPSFVTNVWQLFSGPSITQLIRRLWPMMLCICLGTIAGSALLVRVDPLWSGFGLGIALMVYAGYALIAPTFSVSMFLERWLSPVIGLITGIVTGATGVFVMPAVPYLASLNMNREEFVQALGLSFTVSTVALAFGLFAHDAFQATQLGTSAVAIIPALIGMWAGQYVRMRISPKRFRQCFLLFLILLGLELASRPLL